ncbi:hypothetical protein MPTK1_8g01800 [Marchantia polymorpha subsp. ruderalis]|nr:hypothetical protein MARPO_0064s0020 [Marchantia polymorpha]BBN18345.1 hypothetical protein Mp_8g01800 [Marchantia polymorpha subsp. ruderalis]|eukprot:PTQ36329.1 hypothetical protein MARPO_0064s0020 [Marchantia polymorpha]
MEAKRLIIVKERMVDLEFKISRLGILGKAYYELAQIKLKRHRNQIRVARTQNMLLHAALNVLREKARVARKNAGDLEALRKSTVSLRVTLNHQRELVIAKQHELERQVTDTHSAELETAGFLDPNTPPLIKIRNLEHRLNIVMIKTRDVQTLMKHYEDTVKPMRDEHNSYAAQLEAVQSIVFMKNAETEKLILSHHDAIRARDAAKVELEELMNALFGTSRKKLVSPELEKKILKAIKEIKEVMDVDSMRQMYHQFILQEKQTAYLDQIYVELKRTVDQLKNEYPARRRSSMAKPELHGLVGETRQIVRRQSERNLSMRRGSVPLFQILEGAQKLVDKLHDGNMTLTDDESPERNILFGCEERLTKILKALHRKMKHLQKEAERKAAHDAIGAERHEAQD